MAVKTISRRKEELQWQAQDDAMIMARYQEILNDKSRMNRAVKEAQKQANELQKRATTLQKVATRSKKDGK